MQTLHNDIIGEIRPTPETPEIRRAVESLLRGKTWEQVVRAPGHYARNVMLQDVMYVDYITCCRHCHRIRPSPYMLRDKIWTAIGGIERTIMCFSCADAEALKSLGRRLTADDFTDADVNIDWKYLMQPR